MAKTSRGRGWHGDSAGHAKAGRKGGLARARNTRTDSSQSGAGDVDDSE